MICPNCGRELPDTARVCPSCNAVQRAYRRKRAEADVETQTPRAHVARRVTPQTDAQHQREQTRAQNIGTVSTPNRVPTVDKTKKSGQGSRMPIGLEKQKAYEQAKVRHVRHAPDNLRRKIDASPENLNPPIYQRSHKRLLHVLLAVLMLLLFIGAAGGYMLINTENGQQMMAQWGWSIARTESYVTLGRELVDQGYYTRAIQTLQTAIDREPENIDALISMAQAYTELGRIDEAKAIYESLINDIAPSYPNSYRNLIKIYQDEGYNAEALALMKVAAEKTGTQEFDVMLREYTPTAPTLSKTAGRYSEEIDVTITIPEGETVYYSTDGTDPSESGLIYTAGTSLHVAEGKMTIKAIGFTENGTPSEQGFRRITRLLFRRRRHRKPTMLPVSTKKRRKSACVRAMRRTRTRRRLSRSITPLTDDRRRRNRRCITMTNRSSCRRVRARCALLPWRQTAKSAMK